MMPMVTPKATPLASGSRRSLCVFSAMRKVDSTSNPSSVSPTIPDSTANCT